MCLQVSADAPEMLSQGTQDKAGEAVSQGPRSSQGSRELCVAPGEVGNTEYVATGLPAALAVYGYALSLLRCWPPYWSMGPAHTHSMSQLLAQL